MDVDLYVFKQTLWDEKDETGESMREWALNNGDEKMAYSLTVETAPHAVKEHLKKLGYADDDWIMVIVQ